MLIVHRLRRRVALLGVALGSVALRRRVTLGRVALGRITTAIEIESQVNAEFQLQTRAMLTLGGEGTATSLRGR